MNHILYDPFHLYDFIIHFPQIAMINFEPIIPICKRERTMIMMVELILTVFSSVL